MDEPEQTPEPVSLTMATLTGDEIKAVLGDLARLRIEVFRDWPYLYDGSLDYEEQYLSTFAAAPGAVCIVARSGDRIVGASTGSPMEEADEEFQRPYEEAGYDIKEIFYCGESVLLPQYRGGGAGHAFFDGREAHARKLGGFKYATFCRVLRSDFHPLKPADYRPLDGFWRKRGYRPTDLEARYAWKDIDQKGETVKHLQFWLKEL
ncbi:MAG: GNAT family N-acetyltransferase [Hyphomicrobiaceae bacterium]